jgi:hypothetical protein
VPQQAPGFFFVRPEKNGAFQCRRQQHRITKRCGVQRLPNETSIATGPNKRLRDRSQSLTQRTGATLHENASALAKPRLGTKLRQSWLSRANGKETCIRSFARIFGGMRMRSSNWLASSLIQMWRSS